MEKITIETTVNAPIEKVWQYWNDPAHITQWAFASDDWMSPSATNDLTVGGTFSTRMESKDGAHGFDFGGTYTAIDEGKSIDYTIEDGRTVHIEFIPEGEGIKIVESFDPEKENTLEMQQARWQAILENFKKHVESN